MAEPSDTDFAVDSLDGVTRLLSHWIAKSPDGWASVVFRSYLSAEKAIQRLQAAHGTEAAPIVDPGVNDEALSTLLRQIEAAKPGQTLLVKLGPQSEEFFGLLNLHRENIRDHAGLRIVFWMGQEAYRRLLHAARDFESWVQLRLRLDELPAPLPILDHRESSTVPSVHEWSTEERIRVEDATRRIQKSRSAAIDEQEIWQDILAPTLDWLIERGVREATIRWFVEMRVRAANVALLLEQSDRLVRWGQLSVAELLLVEEGIPLCPSPSGESDLIQVYDRLAEVFERRGELSESLRMRRELILPLTVKLGLHYAQAVTQGKIADILMARGDLDEALRIRLQEEIPVYTKLGDVHSVAVTKGQISDILKARGDLDEALRILQQEVAPTFERLVDVRELAVTQGKIADILRMRGNFDEALRILQQEAAPALKKIGDLREWALTQGKIANVLLAQGDLDGAITLFREQALPTMEKLGARDQIALGKAHLARLLQQRAKGTDCEEAQTLLAQAHSEAKAMKLPLAHQLEESTPPA